MSDENNFKPTLEGYKPLRPFNLFMKNNFPFIENTFEALDTYGLICELVKYLNTVIENVNTVESNVGELYNAFSNLNDYVAHYFDNLDVQEEINNKLDEMAENGTLTELIGEYVLPLFNDFSDDIDERLDVIDNKVERVMDQNPIPVSSVDDMTDTTRIYLNTSNGYWYYYNVDTWTQGGVYQSTIIPDHSIGTEKTDFIKYKNYFDNTDEDIITGKYLDQNGDEVINNQFSETGYIPTLKGDTWNWQSAGAYVCFYDVNKDFVSSIQTASGSSTNPGSFTVPNNDDIAFCRLPFRTVYTNSKTLVLTKGLEKRNPDLVCTDSKIFENIDEYKLTNKNLQEYQLNNINDKEILTSYTPPSSNNFLQVIFPVFAKKKIEIFAKYEFDPSTLTGLVYYILGSLYGYIDSEFTQYFKENEEIRYNNKINHIVIDFSQYEITNFPNFIKMTYNIKNTDTTHTYNFNIKDLVIIQDDVILDNRLLQIGNIDGLEVENNYLKKYSYDSFKDIENKNIAILGDSISAYNKSPYDWKIQLKKFLPFKNIYRYARSGATWTNTENTEYDITSTSASYDESNVIWNQYNKLINDYTNEDIEKPDICLILAGTNDLSVFGSDYFGDVDEAFTGSIIDKQVTSILTVAESIRYVCELLLSQFPDLKIIIATPLQRGNLSQLDMRNLSELMKDCANRLSCEVINQTTESGIYGYNEESSHIFLQDKVHPNARGAEKIGKFICSKLLELL